MLQSGMLEHAMCSTLTSQPYLPERSNMTVGTLLRNKCKPLRNNRVCCEPRLTFVVLNVESFRILLGSCYILQQKHGREERPKVVDHMTTVVNAHGGKGAMIVRIDANARVPTQIGQVTGGLPVGKDDEEEHAHLTVPRGEAAGVESIRPELLKAAAAAAVQLFYPLVLKSTLRIQQLFQWKGGLLYESYKKSGSAEMLESYRPLYIAIAPEKLFHKVLRGRMNDLTTSRLGGLHCGAKAGSPVLAPSLALHLLVRAAAKSEQSAAILYVDTKTAYYAITRELALSNIYDDGFAVRLFERFNWRQLIWQSSWSLFMLEERSLKLEQTRASLNW